MNKAIFVALIVLLAATCHADVPRVLNHQGMLTDATGTSVTGDTFMIFALYESSSGGTSIWSEAQLVSVDHGVFNVYLGETTILNDALFLGQDIWLGVTVGDDDEMTPRLRMGSVLYAFTANNDALTGGVWYADTDGDGYGDPADSVTNLTQPPGYVADGTDCDDTADYIHPGAEEFCDGLDYNCDGHDALGLFGPPCPLQAGVCGGATMPCGGTAGWLPCSSDDYGPDFEPNEVSCDGLDNDCNGIPDDGIDCSDGNSCTGDYCDPQSGCMHDPLVGYACNDGNPCTYNDACNGAGFCEGTPYTCSDGISCTEDICNGDGTCSFPPMPSTCYINGQCYAFRERNPMQDCQECNPAVSQTAWTSVLDGTICTGGECIGGVCTPLAR